jgi:hypothetical protein
MLRDENALSHRINRESFLQRVSRSRIARLEGMSVRVIAPNAAAGQDVIK